jgi:hypothetical protein
LYQIIIYLKKEDNTIAGAIEGKNSRLFSQHSKLYKMKKATLFIKFFLIDVWLCVLLLSVIEISSLVKKYLL